MERQKFGTPEHRQSIEQRLNKEIIVPDSRITTILSGGMDSATLLYFAMTKTDASKVHAVSFNYGQKHSRELDSARQMTGDLGVRHSVVDVSGLKDLLNSSLTADEQEVPQGHYAEENMRATVVPNRNAIMLAMAYGAAISDGSSYLLYGAHSGDHFIYPDCRPEFVEALDKAFAIGNEGFGKTKIVAPFSEMSKSEIVTFGMAMGTPYENTWTCYEGKDRPCLGCGTCVERTEAFMDNDSRDPLLTAKEWDIAMLKHASAKQNYERGK